MKGHAKNFHSEHEARVIRHLERLQMLSALLQTHESFPYDNQDRDYIRDLKYRIGKVRTQLRNMGETYLLSQTKNRKKVMIK